ncbi:MAG: HAMP domain-containing histidine kinase [Elusimicrobia bacterium]|nr:HAMP domain-containing histidine kinase [Elusimicrobiota bacterium]
MLSDFLSGNRQAIHELSRRKVAADAGSAPDAEAWNQGLPEVFDHIIASLQRAAKYGFPAAGADGGAQATQRGEKMLRLGLTVSQVVQGYSAVCQSITEAAREQGFVISADEFHTINRVLDLAIAEAVTGYEHLHDGIVAKAEALRLGMLAHELRNALTNVTLAHLMIRDGLVGARGETSAVLEKGLRRMTDIIDRSLAEVRLHSEPLAEPRRLRLLDLVDEVWVTASSEAKSRGISLLVQVASEVGLEADPQHLVSALSNLVQNAIKFTKPGTTVCLRARELGDQVLIEVEDGCGGLPPGRAEELFRPFTQEGKDRSGVGLGLAISRQAIERNGGTLTVRDLAGKGCVFTITLPRTAGKTPPAPAVAS